MADVVGWNWMYKIIESDIKNKEDVLTLLIHFLLIKKGFKCLGLGDDKTIGSDEDGSESLPPQWNATSNYSLRYRQNDVLHILKGVLIDENIVYNLLRVDTLAVTNVAFNINDTVGTAKGSLETLFKNNSQEIIDKIRLELLNTGCGKEVTTQTSSATGESNSTVQHTQTGTSTSQPVHPLHVFRPPAAYPDPFWANPDRDPSRIGRGDLDPFRIGGGMIFNPFGPRGIDPGAGIPGGLPRGAVPPGARFDPFGPHINNPRPRYPPPDPDNDA